MSDTQALRVGIGGPVGSGKTALTLSLCRALRDKFNIAVVTNGIPAVQAGKLRALGLRPLVDTVIFATEHGSGRGKPDREPFEAALVRLGVSAQRAVFVGDNEDCDVRGAAAAGLRTIRLVSRATAGHRSAADAVVRSMRDVPAAVRHIDRAVLPQQDWSRDVA